MEKFDFSGYATRNDLLCSDGRTIRKDAFKHCDGQTVPLVYSHNHNDPDNILGHALLENRDDGVYAYCTFNGSDSATAMKEAVRHGDVRSLSIYANKLKQSGGDVLHGFIREVSIVLAGANPGAFIDSVMIHGEDTEDGLIVGYDENIMIHHYTETREQPAEQPIESPAEQPEETIQHADDKQNTNNDTKEESNDMAETKKPAENTEKTVKEVFDTLTEEQKTVVYALIGQALEDAGVADEDENDENVEHSEGGYAMKHNVFDNDIDAQEGGFLSHADQVEILKMAKSTGSFKTALSTFAENNKNALAHGITETTLDQLFPDFTNVDAIPDLVERDHTWVANVMKKAHKTPAARIRTRHANATADGIRAKGYVRSKNEGKKALSAAIAAIVRTTEPQTVYYRDDLHRDDVLDMDFDVITYQKKVMKNGLEEEVAVAALIGDGRDTTSPDKISIEKIRPVWGDNEVYTIQALVDTAAAKANMQGTGTAANFGENFIFAESVIEAVLKARVDYKGAGVPDYYCAPSTLNKMLMARDMNGRRIYESSADVAKALNVGAVHTVAQMENKTREDEDGNEFKLHGLIVDMANYTFGCAKGGEITTFEDFDIDFNNYKYLMETRLSGALAHPYSAIAVEEAVVAG